MSTSKFIVMITIIIVNLVARPPLDLSKISICVYFIHFFASKFTLLAYFCTEISPLASAPPPYGKCHPLGAFIMNNSLVHCFS